MGRPKKTEPQKKIDLTEEFPFDSFPWKLVFKDGSETRKCYFQTEDHRDKHIERNKLKKNQIQLSYKYDIPEI
jgi:hypothetical protein